MPVFKDQYPSQLPAQAQTALLDWYIKNLKKDEKLTKEEHAERIIEKVRRVMRVQFPAEKERIAALPDQAWIIERFDEVNHIREQSDLGSAASGEIWRRVIQEKGASSLVDRAGQPASLEIVATNFRMVGGKTDAAQK